MKRIFAFVMALVMILSLFAVPASAKTYAKGDMDGDGKIDSADAIYLLYHVLFGAARYPLAGEEGWVEPEPPVTPEPDEPEENDEVLDLEKKDLGGHEFRFLSRSSNLYHLDTHEIYAEALNGDKINDVVFTRNAQIEREYNCKILEEKFSSPVSSAYEPLLAGEYVADFLYDEARLLRKLAASDLLANLSAANHMNLEKAWYDQNALRGLNLNGQTFYIVGDASLSEDKAAYVVRFNKDFIAEYDDGIDLFEEVRDGKWTIDRMYELMTATAKELNGDGILTFGEDRFGYAAEREANWAHVAACGVSLSNVDDSGNYDIPLSPKQELLDAWAALKPLLTSPCRLNGDGDITKGLCTFSLGSVGSLLNRSETFYDLGLVPLPKLDEDQEKYHTTVSFSQLCAYAIPLTADNGEDYRYNGFSSGVEQAAYFLEVFSYYSMSLVTPAFYDQIILKQTMRDRDSAEMLEIALENKIYDPVVGYDMGGMSNLFALVGSGENNNTPGTDVNYDTLVSAYESRVSAARKALSNFINYVDVTSVT